MKKLKLLVAIGIMLALSLFLLTACPQPSPYNYHTVTWNATGATVVASFAGESIANGAEVRENSNVVFTWNQVAEGYRMRITVAGNDPTYHLREVTTFTQNISRDTSIVFAVIPLPVLDYFAVAWVGEGITATVQSVPITSSETLLESAIITFLWVAPSEGYSMRITVGENAPTYHPNTVTTWNHTVTGNIEIRFEVVPNPLPTFRVDWTNPENFPVIARVDGIEIQSGNYVTEGRDIVFIWELIPPRHELHIISYNVDLVRTGAGSWRLANITENRVVEFLLEFIPPSPVEITWEGEGVIATANGGIIQSGDAVPNGSNITFTWNAPQVDYRMRIAVNADPVFYRDRNVTTWTLSNVLFQTHVVFTESQIPTTTHEILIDARIWSLEGISFFELTDYMGNRVSNGARVPTGTTLVTHFEVLPGHAGILTSNPYPYSFPRAFPHGTHSIHHTITENSMFYMSSFFFANYPNDVLFLVFNFLGFQVWEVENVEAPLGLEEEIWQFSAIHINGFDYVRSFEVYDHEMALKIKPTFLMNLGSIGFEGNYVVVYHDILITGTPYATNTLLRFLVADWSSVYRTRVLDYIKNFKGLTEWADYIQSLNSDLDLFYLHPQFIGALLDIYDHIVVSLVGEDRTATYGDPAVIRLVKLDCREVLLNHAIFLEVDALIFGFEDINIGISDCGYILIIGKSEYADALIAKFGGTRDILNLDHIEILKHVIDYVMPIPNVVVYEFFFWHPALANYIGWQDHMVEALVVSLMSGGEIASEARVYAFYSQERASEFLEHVLNEYAMFTLAVSGCGYIIVRGFEQAVRLLVESDVLDFELYQYPFIVGTWELGEPNGDSSLFSMNQLANGDLFDGVIVHITIFGRIEWWRNNALERVGEINPFGRDGQFVSWFWFAPGICQLTEVLIRYVSWLDAITVEVWNYQTQTNHDARFHRSNWTRPEMCLNCDEHPCSCLYVNITNAPNPHSDYGTVMLGTDTINDGDLLSQGDIIRFVWTNPAGYVLTLMVNGVNRIGNPIAGNAFEFFFTIPARGPVNIVWDSFLFEDLRESEIIINRCELEENQVRVAIVGGAQIESGDEVQQRTQIVIEWVNIAGYAIAFTINGIAHTTLQTTAPSGGFNNARLFVLPVDVDVINIVFTKTQVFTHATLNLTSDELTFEYDFMTRINNIHTGSSFFDGSVVSTGSTLYFIVFAAPMGYTITLYINGIPRVFGWDSVLGQFYRFTIPLTINVVDIEFMLVPAFTVRLDIEDGGLSIYYDFRVSVGQGGFAEPLNDGDYVNAGVSLAIQVWEVPTGMIVTVYVNGVAVVFGGQGEYLEHIFIVPSMEALSIVFHVVSA